MTVLDGEAPDRLGDGSSTQRQHEQGDSTQCPHEEEQGRQLGKLPGQCRLVMTRPGGVSSVSPRGAGAVAMLILLVTTFFNDLGRLGWIRL